MIVIPIPCIDDTTSDFRILWKILTGVFGGAEAGNSNEVTATGTIRNHACQSALEAYVQDDDELYGKSGFLRRKRNPPALIFNSERE